METSDLLQTDGQRQKEFALLANRLPLSCGVCRQDLAVAWGCHIGEINSDLFFDVVLPESWNIVPTINPYYLDLFDGKGRVRAHIFYKVTYNTRLASMSIVPRYELKYDHETRGSWVMVIDNQERMMLHGAGYASFSDHAKRNRLIEYADEWLSEHYPLHTNPLAYWNDNDPTN